MTEQNKEQILATLPPVPMHPEPRSFAWSKLEKSAITTYGKACAIAALAHPSSHPKSKVADSDVIADAHPAKGTSAFIEKACRCVGCKHVYFDSNVSCDCAVPALHQFTTCYIVDVAPVVPAPVAQLSELTDQQMDTVYRDVWTTVPHDKRLFEFGRRVSALAAAPTTPKDAS